MAALQDVVYNFFTAGRALSLNEAILQWQAEQGYLSPSVTMNWMAIAQDNSIQYLGDPDMQNGFATGRYELEEPEDPEDEEG